VFDLTHVFDLEHTWFRCPHPKQTRYQQQQGEALEKYQKESLQLISTLLTDSSSVHEAETILIRYALFDAKDSGNHKSMEALIKVCEGEGATV